MSSDDQILPNQLMIHEVEISMIRRSKRDTSAAMRLC